MDITAELERPLQRDRAPAALAGPVGGGDRGRGSGIATGTVKSHTSRAMQHLEELLPHPKGHLDVSRARA